jgi:ribosomal protein S18 acetylase RimI-like enzyme
VERCALALHRSPLGEHYFPAIAAAEAAVREFVDGDGFLVAEDDEGGFVGFACVLARGAFHSFPYLHLLVVDPQRRGKGDGARLMDLLEERLFAARPMVFLVVASFNDAALRFYERRGYQQIGVIPSLYRTGIDERLLFKRAPGR